MGGLSPGQHAGTARVPTARRWLADPLPLMLLVGGTGVALAVLGAAGPPVGTGAALWVVPALFAVVVAGLALSGST